MSIHIILGLGYGDEGKGKEVSRLCEQYKYANTLVVRFSGGHQAGHTVVYNNQRHVFSSFGSGTLQSIPTYWSRFCTVYPIALINEYQILKDLGLNPIIFIDPLCPITTPYDVNANIMDSNNINHGSVGVGINKTHQRNQDMYKLHFMDIFHPNIFLLKMENIKKYYQNNNLPKMNDNILSRFTDSIKMIQNNNIGQYKLSDSYDHIIFEGSQGILLDQDFGFFPHVTRGNTTCKNALILLDEMIPNYNKNIELHYITRSYQTRHGNGPMTKEQKLNLINNESETNVLNQYQGQLRTGLFDIDVVKYAIECNESIIPKNKKIVRNLIINCIDQINTVDNKIIFDNLIINLNIPFKNMFLGYSTNNKDSKRI